jgi:hypothetical protein
VGVEGSNPFCSTNFSSSAGLTASTLIAILLAEDELARVLELWTPPEMNLDRFGGTGERRQRSLVVARGTLTTVSTMSWDGIVEVVDEEMARVLIGKTGAEGGSEKHLRHVAGVLRISGGDVDRDHVAEWAERLGVLDAWRLVVAAAD